VACAAGLIVPGLPGILRDRVRARALVQFLVGVTALISLATAATGLLGANPYYSLDPGSMSGDGYQILAGDPSGGGTRSDLPGTIVVVAELQAGSSAALSVERLVPFVKKGDPMVAFDGFWYFFWGYLVLYVCCAVWSLRDELRRPTEEAQEEAMRR